MSWRDHAACAGMGPEVFHAVDPRPAIEVCAGCPRWVRQACYRDAKANEVRDATAGVYGGVAAHVRAKLTEGYRVPLMVGVLSTADRDATPAQQRSVAYPRPPHKAMSRAERLAERLAAEDDLLGHGWEVIDGKAGRGAGYSVRSDNGRRERLWLSPEAVKHEIQQGFDFGGAA